MKPTIKIIILIFLLAIIAWTSYDMVNLFMEQKLWGYRPLILFSAAWAFVMLLVEHWISKKEKKKWQWLRLSTLSGVLLALGFPDIPLTFLMFIGFVPLLLVEKEISEQKEETNKWEVFKFSYHTFVVWNILTTYWVANTAFVAAIVAIWLNAFFMTIPFVLFHHTKKRMPKVAYWGFVAYWIAFEYVHLNWEISWTWLTLGNAFATFPTWVQWYEWTGVFGGTLWILLANLMFFRLIEHYESYQKQGLFRPALRFGALVIIPIIVSLVMYYNYEEQGTAAEVVVIQPNYEPHYEKFTVSQGEQIRQFLRLSQSQINQNTDYLVFPETSFRSINTSKWESNRPINELKQFLTSYPNLKLVTGISAYREFEEGEEHTEAVREHKKKDGSVLYWEALNAAIQLEDDSSDYQLYVKSKLVPGAEFLPYQSLFFFLEPLVESLDGSMAGHGTRKERTILKSDKGNIAPQICYESVYGEYSTEYIRKGANAIFIMTNDGWWDKTAGHRQHLLFASLRAIETRRSIARSANTGISAFINQRGDISQATQYGEEAAIKGTILMNDKKTLYVRWGDFIARIGLFTAIILFLNSFVRGRLKE